MWVIGRASLGEDHAGLHDSSDSQDVQKRLGANLSKDAVSSAEGAKNQGSRWPKAAKWHNTEATFAHVYHGRRIARCYPEAGS